MTDGGTPRRLGPALACAAVLLVTACDAGTTGRTARGAGAPPALGATIDRAGRAGTPRTLVGTFDQDPAARDDLRDAWNTAPRAEWSSFEDDVLEALAVWDAADGACGDPALAEGDDVYGPLARLLIDDKLYVDTAATPRTVYLGVELATLGLIDPSDGGSGGREPTTDAMDPTLSLLIVGALEGVTDRVFFDDATPPDGFPYVLVMDDD